VRVEATDSKYRACQAFDASFRGSAIGIAAVHDFLDGGGSASKVACVLPRVRKVGRRQCNHVLETASKCSISKLRPQRKDFRERRFEIEEYCRSFQEQEVERDRRPITNQYVARK